MKNKVLLDLDGVIANFYYGFATFLNGLGCQLDPTGDPAHYSFKDWGPGTEKIDFDTAAPQWILNDGFEKLPFYDGSIEFAKKLLDKYDVYIVTARVGDWESKFGEPIKNKIKENTYKWLQRAGIPTTQLYFESDKVPFCQERGISVMVEDKLDTALKGAKEGLHTVLINRDYNQSKADRLRIYRVTSFDEALAQLDKIVQ